MGRRDREWEERKEEEQEKRLARSNILPLHYLGVFPIVQ